MPYRHRFEPCHECQHGTTVGRCARCGSALCVGHLPLGGERCGSCEARYARYVSALPLKLWWLAGFSLATPLLLLLAGPLRHMYSGKIWVWAPLTSGLAAVEAAIILLGGGMLLARGMVALRLGMARRRFLG